MRPRAGALDSIRGALVVSMVLFHATYDLAYLYGIDMPWFTDGVWQEVWRCSISWSFLFLAGYMTAFSRNNARRGLKYLLAAVAIYAVTSVVKVDTPISYGIIFCMAASTLLVQAVGSLTDKLPAAPLAIASFLLFLALYGLPRETYDVQGLAWLGLPSAVFASGDYYPVLPYSLMYMTGSQIARWYKQRTSRLAPEWAYKHTIRPLAFIGRHALTVYLIHQPVLFVLWTVLYGA